MTRCLTRPLRTQRSGGPAAVTASASVDESPLTVEPLGPHHDRASFSCGELSLDRYIRRQASQDARRRVARVFVASGDPPERVADYYTLSAAGFEKDNLPAELARRLPHYPVPADVIERLAVDLRSQGAGSARFCCSTRSVGSCARGRHDWRLCRHGRCAARPRQRVLRALRLRALPVAAAAPVPAASDLRATRALAVTTAPTRQRPRKSRRIPHPVTCPISTRNPV